jgi:hypothetical protein
MPLTPTVLPPELVRRTVWVPERLPVEVLAKVTLEGDTLATAATSAPVPESATDRLPAFVAIATEAERAPIADGVKVAAIVHDAPGATVAPAAQDPLRLKSAAWVPCRPSEEIENEALPVLESVTDLAALVVPIVWLPKSMLPAESVGAGTSGVASTPVPDSATECGLPVALVVTVIAAVRVPDPTGANWTRIVQDAPAATVPLAGQVPDPRRNSLEWVPDLPMPEIVSEPLPVFESVTICAALTVPTVWLPKATELVLSDTAGTTATPEPVSETEGVPALVAIASEPLRVPDAEGVKVTDRSHPAPAASDVPAPQPERAKSPEFVPPSVSELTVSEPPPVLVSRTVRAELVVPTFWLPNDTAEVLSEATGAASAPVPVRDTACGLPGASDAMDTDAVRVPAASGVKVTVIVHDCPAPSVPPEAQVPARLKSVAWVPVMPREFSVSVALPELVSVTVCAGLVVESVWEAKVREDGESDTAGVDEPAGAP